MCNIYICVTFIFIFLAREWGKVVPHWKVKEDETEYSMSTPFHHHSPHIQKRNLINWWNTFRKVEFLLKSLEKKRECKISNWTAKWVKAQTLAKLKVIRLQIGFWHKKSKPIVHFSRSSHLSSYLLFVLAILTSDDLLAPAVDQNRIQKIEWSHIWWLHSNFVNTFICIERM